MWERKGTVLELRLRSCIYKTLYTQTPISVLSAAQRGGANELKPVGATRLPMMGAMAFVNCDGGLGGEQLTTGRCSPPPWSS